MVFIPRQSWHQPNIWLFSFLLLAPGDYSHHKLFQDQSWISKGVYQVYPTSLSFVTKAFTLSSVTAGNSSVERCCVFVYVKKFFDMKLSKLNVTLQLWSVWSVPNNTSSSGHYISTRCFFLKLYQLKVTGQGPGLELGSFKCQLWDISVTCNVRGREDEGLREHF